MINLFPFQAEAATQIADRYRKFITDPDRPSRRGYGPQPYYQTLRALTGAGKTPILAAVVSEMRVATPIEPIVLWISKGKVVVDQTLANFSDGGKYAHLLPHFQALALRDAVPDQVHDGAGALILLGTVATFNSKERGDRRIFERGQDAGKESLWEALIDRTVITGKKRPLIVVYDEGHNLTDQQGDLLLELRPDALVVASHATPTTKDHRYHRLSEAERLHR
jgi:type III restriction enzyme